MAVNKNKLIARMFEAGFTQATLATAVGMSKNSINAKINGKSSFYLDQVERICDALHIIAPDEKADTFLS